MRARIDLSFLLGWIAKSLYEIKGISLYKSGFLRFCVAWEGQDPQTHMKLLAHSYSFVDYEGTFPVSDLWIFLPKEVLRCAIHSGRLVIEVYEDNDGSVVVEVNGIVEQKLKAKKEVAT